MELCIMYVYCSITAGNLEVTLARLGFFGL